MPQGAGRPHRLLGVVLVSDPDRLRQLGQALRLLNRCNDALVAEAEKKRPFRDHYSKLISDLQDYLRVTSVPE